MPLPIILGLLLLGLMAGIFSGVVGIGGGIIIVPALVYLFGLSQHQAQGTTLGLLMFPVGILAVIQYYKQGYIDYRFVVCIAIGFIAGGYLGGKLAVNIPDVIIKKVFALLMIVLAIKILFFDK
ncbi:sulfite exporter TauE/SafE family protein [Chitinophaga pendula]|uniref:sulfite exporter TauE/SafE family protein n=1 Tax=Chitinophaga TaxID=79328 RepID=UPI000BB06CAD|nr:MULTISPECIES: sulfite exporter TauE/SafE family protein [Chitinophaga]ASZ13616.1 permease [Chitinophaga sp. MD30]UCJ08759.1 sulfite exporter TauE/SafE family protein [Chitinophaga pendula]